MAQTLYAAEEVCSRTPSGVGKKAPWQAEHEIESLYIPMA